MEKIVFLGMLLLLLIPGVFVYQTVGCLFPLHPDWKRRLILFFGCTVSGNMVIFFGDWGNLPPSAALFMTGILLGCEGGLMKRVTLGMMLVSTISAYSAILDNLPGFAPAPVMYVILRGAGFLILYLCVRRLSPDREFELGAMLWRVLLLLTVVPVGIVISIVLMTSENRNGSIGVLLFLSGLSVFSIVGILGAVIVFDRQKSLEEAQNLAEMNRKYYEAMEHQNFETRRLKHDLSNHLQVLAALPENEKNTYIQELVGNPLFTDTLKYCEDDTVNVILGSKAARMKQKGIEFRVKADIGEHLPMEKTDICAIFGNLLDNAAEAAQKCRKESYVSLETRFGRGMLVLRVENPVPDGGEGGKGKMFGIPHTTKENEEMHGYGLKSVSRAAEKYGGKIELSQEDGVFRAFLYCVFQREDPRADESRQAE